MTLTLNQSEIATLTAMQTQAQAKTMGYWQIYQWLGDRLESKGVAADDQALLLTLLRNQETYEVAA